MSDEAGIILVLLGLFGLAWYFLPGIIAAARHKRNTASVFALNLFLGWTLIGWVIALVWALAHDTPPAPPVTVVYQQPATPPPAPEPPRRPPSVMGL